VSWEVRDAVEGGCVEPVGQNPSSISPLLVGSECGEGGSPPKEAPAQTYPQKTLGSTVECGGGSPPKVMAPVLKSAFHSPGKSGEAGKKSAFHSSPGKANLDLSPGKVKG
jgi:hypothetical protein